MNRPASPYLALSDDCDVLSRLILLKEAASRYHCSADTLKNNAKTPNLRAYQDGFGAPVLVLPGDVEDFLKKRPAVASIFHPQRGKPAGTVAEELPPAGGRDGQPANGAAGVPVAGFDDEGECEVLGLSCLRGATSAELVFAARLCAELAGRLTSLAGNAVLMSEQDGRPED